MSPGRDITITMATLFMVVCVFMTVAHANGDFAANNARLLNDLLSKKSTFTRPVSNSSQTIRYGVGVALINFESLDETKGNLKLNLWMRELWTDISMRWDPSQYGGIDHTRIPTGKIWTPDIQLYNSREETKYQDALAVVSSDGTVLHISPARTTSNCVMDLTYFPFDEQTCILKFGTWTYDGFKVDIDFYDGLEQIDMTDYIHNQEWDIVSTSAKKNVKYYPCCEEPYPDLTFSLTFQRTTSYYTYVYLGPAVVLALLAPFIFLLPPGDPQKMTIGAGLLVCFTLFFMEMATMLGRFHYNTPLLDKYYMTIYVMLCVAMALSTLVSNLAKRTMSFRHPPDIIKKILLSCLGRCLCVSYNMYGNLAADDEHGESKDAGSGLGVMQRQTPTGDHIKEWLLIATVVDRLFFLVYLVLTIVLTIIILAFRG